MHNNRRWITAVVAVMVVTGVVAVASGAFSGHARDAAGRPASTAKRPAHRPHPLRPVYNPPSGDNSGISSAQQRADDAKLAATNDHPAQWAAVSALNLPAPAASADFPAISHATRQSPDSYATAFVTELLNIDFAKQTRAALLAWAVSETSPDTMPGTPTPAAAKVLYADLEPAGSPLPTPAVWSANAASGVTWTTSNVTMTPAPIWTQVLATGWQPPDPRMNVFDVTGNLTVTQRGRPPAVKPFSLQLGLGTAEYHNGYGAMSVNNWTEG
ncbi:MAG: hypothetical protein M0Z95_21950 [Actinomycetota bacterium]|jgi:ABC-type cobalt transport system substrate-binding protein|nr:hypothetical protein [Actinomycetota bacterium]